MICEFLRDHARYRIPCILKWWRYKCASASALFSAINRRLQRGEKTLVYIIPHYYHETSLMIMLFVHFKFDKNMIARCPGKYIYSTVSTYIFKYNRL